MPELILKPGRERSVLRHHPWIFSGSVARIIGTSKIGETVDVISSDGDLLAKAAYNPNSNIIARIWTWDPLERVDEKLLDTRLREAIESRNKFQDSINSDARRLVHGESDNLPGLILDQYGDTFVVQFLTAGVEYWKQDIIDSIVQNTKANSIYERSDVDVRDLEGLPPYAGLLYGQSPDPDLFITENGIKFNVDVISGHKTGFYLDQRDNRLKINGLSRELKVLDCFSYTGGFAINALAGGASFVTLVDSSSSALTYARKNFELNNIHLDNVNIIEQDVFKLMRTLRDMGETYDLVILDPPKFAPTAAQAERAARGYKDINLLALKILRPGGLLVTFSCSGGISEDLFQKIIAGAALDAGVEALILERLHQGIDHPVALNFPEGAYLKGFVIQKRK
jgi:23S rRNA (cytosine1962-C5)-methyltransferase